MTSIPRPINGKCANCHVRKPLPYHHLCGVCQRKKTPKNVLIKRVETLVQQNLNDDLQKLILIQKEVSRHISRINEIKDCPHRGVQFVNVSIPFSLGVSDRDGYNVEEEVACRQCRYVPLRSIDLTFLDLKHDGGISAERPKECMEPITKTLLEKFRIEFTLKPIRERK